MSDPPPAGHTWRTWDTGPFSLRAPRPGDPVCDTECVPCRSTERGLSEATPHGPHLSAALLKLYLHKLGSGLVSFRLPDAATRLSLAWPPSHLTVHMEDVLTPLPLRPSRVRVGSLETRADRGLLSQRFSGEGAIRGMQQLGEARKGVQKGGRTGHDPQAHRGLLGQAGLLQRAHVDTLCLVVHWGRRGEFTARFLPSPLPP